MKKLLSISVLLFALQFGTQAQAAGQRPVDMTASGAIVGTQVLWCQTPGTVVDRACTFTQVAAYINSLVSGDCTATGTGAFTCTKTNGTAFGALATVVPGTGIAAALAANVGSAGAPVLFNGAGGTPTSLVGTNITGTGAGFTAGNVTTNANLTGDVTSVGNATTLTNAPVIAKILTGFTSGAGTVSAADSILSALQKINGNDALKAPLASPTFTGVPAAPTATVGTNTTQLATTAFVIANAGSGAVSSVTGSIGITCSPTTGSVVCSAPATTTNNTGTTDTITSANKGTIITESNAASIAVSITTAGFVATDYFTVKNLKTLAGVATYTPSSGTIDGAATLVCQPGQSADIVFGGTNYTTLANTCQLGALATVTPGSNVATAAAVALSGAGGLASTIFRGTAVLGTSAIGSGACATVVTVAATNVATTDVVTASYNSDPTAVTGYGASATGAVLSVYPYPTSGNILVKVCNSTGGSITPGAMTVNVSAVR